MTDAPLPADNSVRKIARLRSRPGRAGELREALKILEAATAAEPGCVEFAFYQALANDESFLLLEHFADEAAFTLHLQLPHTRAFFAAQLVESVRTFDMPPLD